MFGCDEKMRRIRILFVLVYARSDFDRRTTADNERPTAWRTIISSNKHISANNNKAEWEKHIPFRIQQQNKYRWLQGLCRGSPIVWKCRSFQPKFKSKVKSFFLPFLLLGRKREVPEVRCNHKARHRVSVSFCSRLCAWLPFRFHGSRPHCQVFSAKSLHRLLPSTFHFAVITRMRERWLLCDSSTSAYTFWMVFLRGKRDGVRMIWNRFQSDAHSHTSSLVGNVCELVQLRPT